ncbi:aromatic acid/H+ symport family MFS transporter [Nonomuraea sp. NPDC000554]|uniref:MFS transporter n=1 Tax=Nonomuraea sp. NPDC000554 TaxID=3154259 RepID=UPI00331E395B
MSAHRRVLLLCWSAILLDGFDLVVLGTVLPALLRDHVWGLTPAVASVIGTVGLVGMILGSLVTGTVNDIIGRRRALVAAVAVFSVFTALCAAAPSAALFGTFRFLAGLGLGGALPTAITLVADHTSGERRGRASTVLMTGYHVGAMLTALLGIVVIPSAGWRVMFVIGALPSLVLVPLMLKLLPESAAASAGKPANPVGPLFRGGLLRATLAFWLTSFMGLLLVYGLNTWLPEIMRQAGYPLGAALGLLLVLNLGAIAGLLAAGNVADRAGLRRTLLGWFAAAAVFLALLSVPLPVVALYTAVFLAGVFVFSAQVLVYAYVNARYPDAIRGTALGWVAGVGRLGAVCGPVLGGAMLTAGIAYPWGFYAFALVAALGAAAITIVRPERAQLMA